MIRAFATGVFQAVYVYTPEVYATNIRGRALGVHTAAARIGALLTPFNAQVLVVYICGFIQLLMRWHLHELHQKHDSCIFAQFDNMRHLKVVLRNS